MDPHAKRTFWALVDGEKKNHSAEPWINLSVLVESSYEPASEQEKFEVLATMRNLYGKADGSNIRGGLNQSPDQVGQREGFTWLRYQIVGARHSPIDIVKPVQAYHRGDSPFED